MKNYKSLSHLQLTISSLTCAILASCFPRCSSLCTNPNLAQSHGGLDGMFAFGNSVCEAGNNNFLVGSKSKANYAPYGVDFIKGPTGRFTNGKTVADLIGDRLGLPVVPAFLDPMTKGKKCIYGVSYASGGSGILNVTGSMLNGVLSMNQQIDKFVDVTLPDLETVLGCDRQQILSRYLFLLALGNNDFQLTYLLGPKNLTLEVFTMKVVAEVSSQLERLYTAGARKFVMVAVNPLGCNPWIIEYTKSNGCNENINKACKQFYLQLVSLVDKLKAKLPGSEFVLVNTVEIILDIINNPSERGFENTSSACCELKSINNLRLVCKEGGTVCSDRTKYVYFDGQHATQAVNDIIASTAFASTNTSQVYPFNIQKLVYPTLRS